MGNVIVTNVANAQQHLAHLHIAHQHDTGNSAQKAAESWHAFWFWFASMTESFGSWFGIIGAQIVLQFWKVVAAVASVASQPLVWIILLLLIALTYHRRHPGKMRAAVNGWLPARWQKP